MAPVVSPLSPACHRGAGQTRPQAEACCASAETERLGDLSPVPVPVPDQGRAGVTHFRKPGTGTGTGTDTGTGQRVCRCFESTQIFVGSPVTLVQVKGALQSFAAVQLLLQLARTP